MGGSNNLPQLVCYCKSDYQQHPTLWVGLLTDVIEFHGKGSRKAPLASESNVEFGRLTDLVSEECPAALELYDGETGQDETDDVWQTRNATEEVNAGELAYPQRRAWVQGAEKISISSHDHDFQPLMSDKRALISDEPPRTGLVGVESAVGLARGVTVAHGDRRGRRPLASGASQTRRS